METIRIFFAGDFCSKPSTSFITISDNLRRVMNKSDLRVCNFEVPLMPTPAVDAYYFQNDDAPAFLQGMGFDIFSFANNHAFDCGNEGFHKTVRALNGKTFGSGTYDDAYKVKIVEIRGVRLGFLAVSYAAQQGVFDDVLEHQELGCAFINDLRFNHDIMEAKKQVDFLFVLPHDGIEYIDVPLPETIARYRDFIDYGADAVIGSHPHCPQGWENYKGKPIFYSLGNFFFNSKPTPDFKANKPHWYEGLCVTLSINESGISYEIFNTINENNRSLSLDERPDRECHNKLICNYLQNKNKYQQYLESAIKRLAREQEFVVVERFYSHKPFSALCRVILKKCKSIITMDPRSSHKSLHLLLKNDARRNLLTRALKND